MITVEWKKYDEQRPKNQGHYLIIIEDASYDGKKSGFPRFGDVAYYHPAHGWSGSAHTLEQSINYWAKFPWPDLRLL